MKQLFKVQISMHTYVHTDTVENAEKMIRVFFPGEYQDSKTLSSQLLSLEVYKPDLKTLQEDGCDKCIPIGNIEGKTCEELIKEEQL